jgi:hypothetical protein
MLYHRVKIFQGSAIRNGKTFYGYKAVCGTPIIASAEMTIGARVCVGPEPHTLCAKCFREAEAEHIEVKLPEDPLAAPCYDEKGNVMRGVREREEGLSAPVNTHEVNLGNNNGLGKYEDRPYG